MPREYKEKSAKNNRKQALFTIVLISLLTVSGLLMVAIPISKAQTENSLPTNAYLALSPNPTGVSQQVTLEMWLIQTDPTAAGPSGGRWQGFTIKVTAPDKTTQTLGPFTANDASFAVEYYTPEQTGNYSFLFSFPGQHVVGINTLSFTPVNTYYTSSNYTSILTVQNQPATSYASPGLPTSYWSRPINSQNSLWYSISGNWLALGAGSFGADNYNATGNFNPYSNAPNSAHILWTKPLMAGGLIGGEFGGTATSNYFTGKSYQVAFSPPIIINGVLFYDSPLNPKEGFYAVDLQTGQTLWYQNSTAQAYLGFNGLVVGWEYPGISLGQVYNYLSPNQEGGFPYLWFTDTSPWKMYDANTGNLILQVANAQTGGVIVEGPNGELLDYLMGDGWIAMWNSSLCIGTLGNYTPPLPIFATNYWVWSTPDGQVLNWNAGIQWNVTVQTYPGESIQTVNSGVILSRTLSGLAGFGPPQSYTTEAGYSATTGKQLWVQNVTFPSGPATAFGYALGPMADGIFTAYDAIGEQWYAYNANTGAKIWGPSAADPDPWGSEALASSSQIAYGVLFGFATDGVRAFNLTTGQLLWSFKGINSGTNFPGFTYYPFESQSMTVADGKIYVQTGDTHGDPIFRGAQLYCVNATTGAPIWNINTFGESTIPISDGILVVDNGYDNQIYAYGMGPSKTTVTAPDVGVTTATPITITGTVMDISTGSQEKAVAANFPNGLPCISDDSMTHFMEAVYMQQPMPTNVTGVPVTISVTDSNHNHYDIGTATTNANGFYSLTWTPIVPGNFTVTAIFAGTQSYYGSSANAAFYASAPSPTASPYPSPVTGLASTGSLELGIAAVIVVIVIIGAVIILTLRKRP